MYLESSYQIFNFILPKVNIDYISRAHIINIDNLTLIKKFMKMFNENIKITNLKHKYHKKTKTYSAFRPLANAGTVGA